MSITENVAAIRARIEAAAVESGRTGADITLVAATKMNDASRVREAVAAGVDVCGENRVQELLEKNEQHAYDGAPLHFIGHLQTNKVKYLVGLVDLIQSRTEEAPCLFKGGDTPLYKQDGNVFVNAQRCSKFLNSL